MTPSPIYNTWSGDPGNGVAPRRPGIDDVGGAAKENDPLDPPERVTMPCAEDDNQHQRQIVSLGKVSKACLVSVHFSGGTPSVASFSAASDNVTTPTFTVTDNGTGDTTISWPANTFPPAVCDHTAKLTGATLGMIVTQTLTNSARVKTCGTGGSADDLPFVLEIG